jgi:hypothetical protein
LCTSATFDATSPNFSLVKPTVFRVYNIFGHTHIVSIVGYTPLIFPITWSSCLSTSNIPWYSHGSAKITISLDSQFEAWKVTRSPILSHIQFFFSRYILILSPWYPGSVEGTWCGKPYPFTQQFSLIGMIRQQNPHGYLPNQFPINGD